MSWLDIFKKNVTVSHAPTVTLPPLNTSGNFYTYNANTTAAVAPAGQQMGTIQVTSGVAAAAIAGNLTVAGGAGGANAIGGFGTFSYAPPPSHLTFIINGKEIVRLNTDGSVEWSNGIDIDEAAEAFSECLTLGAEMSAGITEGVKLRMRDSVFEDLINIAKEKGSLTAEDLTYLLEASKIVEKLKGGN